ncbi:hypothetical protein M427DRAFT_52909 [Gonapodya prolifera JEL478]|uniref:mitogen-activated protein kinase kinase n=1 Tax=Gonapodya prolifera (strain JEL478) TaxID=1344416 RepID=A0A139ARV9_GONPJ|nr:hypothetical protein M427DRAFT_52909 [Gonapodya prolifera JEL478]|eukprot:KXS19477.1 hypothetical protein M427DRAFT_52909 [Gonapodya prolifera JEL478]
MKRQRKPPRLHLSGLNLAAAGAGSLKSAVDVTFIHDDDYEVISHVAGSVWKVMKKDTGDVLARKEFHNKDKKWGQAAAAAIQCTTLKHTNVVQFMGVSSSKHSVGLYMEFVAGSSLGTVMHRRRVFPEDSIATICIATLRGLLYLRREARLIYRSPLGPTKILI